MAVRSIHRGALATLKSYAAHWIDILFASDDSDILSYKDSGGSVRQVVTEDNTQTLTNKTLTSPNINGSVASATGAEIDRVADLSARIVNVTTTPLAIAEATHEGKTIVLNKADGIAITLPAATGSGAIYRFVVGTTASGGSYVFGVTGNDTFKGLALGLDSEGVPANAWAAGASDEVFTMDGSTQGGVVGDEVVFQDIKADVWAVQARLQQSGTEATPFSSAA